MVNAAGTAPAVAERRRFKPVHAPASEGRSERADAAKGEFAVATLNCKRGSPPQRRLKRMAPLSDSKRFSSCMRTVRSSLIFSVAIRPMRGPRLTPNSSRAQVDESSVPILLFSTMMPVSMMPYILTSAAWAEKAAQRESERSEAAAALIEGFILCLEIARRSSNEGMETPSSKRSSYEGTASKPTSA